ncbi:Down syndrome cell adhesion molecule-like protein Dscam2, partial [Limulus polyphemus]|uniref:Down syndrome cell adhesion molecule-like protein Dscam2 n=1 Tax=Limulus polyphemus TaxID=6850 RepID=A0ABM1TRM5_LIMPO
KDVPLNFKPVVSSPHLQVFENGSLSIHNSQENDVGFYLCKATNGIGQGLSKVIKLHVKIAAHFKTKFMAEKVEKGHNIKLKCHARGDQPITIIWLKAKQNINLQGDPRYTLIETVLPPGVTSELLIRQADKQDSALFTCIASNTYGQDDTNIQLIVQEPPDTPQNVHIIEQSSRTVTLRWSAPYSGNSVITKYLVQFKQQSAKWQKGTSNVTISGTETDALISGLKPASVYNMRVIARNGLGFSNPSEAVEVKTEEEAPEGTPVRVRGIATSSKSLKITWKPPNQKLQHGVLLGYYVGYKLATSSDQYVYRTLEIQPDFKEECHLSGLKRFTKYVIIVQAYNSKGAGPSSEELLLQTLESDPPTTPQLKVFSSTPNSISLTWNAVDPDGNPITGFTLSMMKDDQQIEEVDIPGDRESYTFNDLACGSRYQFFLVAYNSVGRGEPCDIVDAKTLGEAPVAPSKNSALSYNSTSLTVNFADWQSGGCPLISFKVRYRRQHAQQWNEVANDFPAKKNYFLDIHGLEPGTWYQLQVVATNEAGKTDAKYVFYTLVTPEVPMQMKPNNRLSRNATPFYLDLTIIIPVAVSVCVIIIVLIALCLVIRRKNTSSSQNGSSVYGIAKGSAQATLRMTDYQKKTVKKKKKKKKKEAKSVYYPTPYATTQLAGEFSEKSRTDEFPQPQEEPLYATVKRTPRPPRSDAHIYQSPVPSLSDMEQLTPSPSPTTSKRSGMMVKLCDTPETKYS